MEPRGLFKRSRNFRSVASEVRGEQANNELFHAPSNANGSGSGFRRHGDSSVLQTRGRDDRGKRGTSPLAHKQQKRGNLRDGRFRQRIVQGHWQFVTSQV